MEVLLGIDTGGTYTDAVLVDHAAGRILFAAKSLTTYDDLARGIGLAVDAVLNQEGAPGPESITLTGLSTTLATNAIVEGRGGRVCLVLVGYDQDLLDSYGLKRALVVDDVIHLAGGHDSQGVEVHPLDEKGLRETAFSRKGKVDAFGVSSYFGVRNPEHETRAAAILEELSGLPVTCGHMLTSRLDSIRRATTVALNAGLIPLIRELIGSVRDVLAQRGIGGQIMVVKGDGSLVEASWAAKRPIETILSGPAASVVGARHLVGEEGNGNFWVMDMGGTTTDIAQLKGGQPRLNPKGAQVGPWRTMVEAVDIRTVGLGGDSRVELKTGGELSLGPERVVPLCLAALEHPNIIEELKKQKRRKIRSSRAAVFLMPQGGGNRRTNSSWEDALLAILEKGPAAWERLVEENGPASFLSGPVRQAAARRLIGICGFTPTDALHVLGRLNLWSAEAAETGAAVLAAQVGLKPKDLARMVIEGVYAGGAEALARAALAGEGLDGEEPGKGLIDSFLIRKALSKNGNGKGDISISLTLNHPVVAIGAPVEAYGPAMVERLRTRLVIPPRAEVANAVGAVVGGVIIRCTALIKPLEDQGGFRLHLPDKVLNFGDREEAVVQACKIMEAWIRESARKAGAETPEVSLDRRDLQAPIGGGSEEMLYLGTELVCTAVGRPSPVIK